MHRVFLSSSAIRDKQKLRNDIVDIVSTTLSDLANEKYLHPDLCKPVYGISGYKVSRAKPPIPASDYRILWFKGECGEIQVFAIWRRDGNTYKIERIKRRLKSSLRSGRWTEWLPSAVAAPISQTSSSGATESDQRQLDGKVTQTPDFDEAEILDYLTELTSAQKALIHINATGPVLIRGVAGSGKTVLGLFRADNISRLRAQAGKDTNILILTFSRALKTTLGWIYSNSFPELPASVQIASFGDWMVDCLQNSGVNFAEMGFQCRKDTIRQIRTDISKSQPAGQALSRMTSSFLLEEIDEIIRGRELKSLAEYKRVKRIGRRKGLNEFHRELVWKVYKRYQQALREQNKFDWAELPALVLQHCRPLPQFDVVVVDEAQDMRPNYLRLATRLIKDYCQHRSITLLGDVAQSIHYSGISWRDAGLPLRGGRTRLMTQNHRNTRQIMDVALPILDKCRSLGNIRRYHSPSSIEKNGETPILVRYTSLDRAVVYIAEEIIALRQSLHLDYSNFAILSPRTLSKSEMFRALKKNLPNYGINCRHFRDEDFMSNDEVGLITMHSAKGLEFPIVFIIDFEEGTIPYVGRSSASPQAIEERARKLAYVSITRATQRLYLVFPKSNPSRFIHDILNVDEHAVEKMDL